MVHGLKTIKRLNDEAVKKAKARGPIEKLEVPQGVGLSPVGLRRHINTPWTKSELDGERCVYESYARSARAPFKGQDGAREGLQG